MTDEMGKWQAEYNERLRDFKPAELYAEITRLRSEVARLTQERDEARNNAECANFNWRAAEKNLRNARDVTEAALRDLKAAESRADALQAENERLKEALSGTPEVIRQVKHYGGFCRDCADQMPNGVCEHTGMPCGDRERATRFVLSAIRYGLEHNFICKRSALAASKGEGPAE